MLVNLSLNSNYAEHQLNSYPEQKLIDVSGSVAHLSGVNPRVIDFSALANANKIYSNSIDHFVKFIGELSSRDFGNSSVRSINIKGLPIFWVTGMAEKHSTFHWGMLLFQFFEVLKTPDVIPNDEKIVLILDKLNEPLKSFIKLNISRFEIEESRVEIQAKSQNNEPSIFQLLKNGLKEIVNVLKANKSTINFPVKNGNLFIGYGKNSNEDHFLRDYLNYALEINSDSSFLPYNHEIIHRSIGNTTKAIFVTLELYLSSIFKFLKLQMVKEQVFDLGDFRINSNLLKYEMLNSIIQFRNLCNYSSLKRFFNACPGEIKVFFQDEFFIQGRIITSAVNNSSNEEIKSYGIQHGLFYKPHTVYVFDKLELQGTNSLPKPDYFLVWGEYFKDFMIKESHFKSEEIIVAGNLNYIQKKGNQISSSINENKIRILWCTTLYNFFLLELAMVKDSIESFIKDSNFSILITFRLHPAGHIKKAQILDNIHFLNTENYCFDNESRLEDLMKESTMIFTGLYSTIWLDGLLQNKSVLRFVSGNTMPIFTDLNLKNLNDIKSKEDFHEFISKNIIDNNSNIDSTISDIQKLIYLNADRWNEVLK